ncbi:hypothetical protein Zmor_001054 [Zophobas morio]|uniref:Ionotropic receptor n=1 Tax=Zophobas morio TaxID=2755281 RepID=A0AA38IYK2_9CUCU|nr:hypothetical protein Zmor_001054 [Zophobas morio]
MQDLVLSSKQLRFNSFWDQFLIGTRFEKEIFKKKIPIPDNENSFSDQVTTFLKNLDHGFVNSNTRMNIIKNHHKLHIVSHDKITTLHSYIMFRKSFPFYVKFNDALLHVIEAGLMSKWLHESQVAEEKFSVSAYKDVEEGYLDLDRIVCVFVLLGVGLLISFLVYVLELLVYRKTQCWKKDNIQKPNLFYLQGVNK